MERPHISLKTGGTEGHTLRWTAWLAERLAEIDSPYAAYFHPGLETQIQPVTDDDAIDLYSSQWPILGAGPRPVRTVITDKFGKPIRSNDGVVDYHPRLIAAAGTSWWNWLAGRTEACFFDFDFGHGGKALDEAGIAKVDEWAARLPYVMCATSKGGRGRHWLVRLADPLPAPTRSDHSINCKRVKAKIDHDLGFDVGPFVCSFGAIQYVWSNNVKGRNCEGS